MQRLTSMAAAGAVAAVLAGPAAADRIYVYETTPPQAQPQVIYTPATPYERVHVDRPYYAYDSYYGYRTVDNSGRSYPVTAQEADRLYGYPYGFDGNPGYLYWDGHRISLASDPGLTRDSNPDAYTSGHYNPR